MVDNQEYRSAIDSSKILLSSLTSYNYERVDSQSRRLRYTDRFDDVGYMILFTLLGDDS